MRPMHGFALNTRKPLTCPCWYLTRNTRESVFSSSDKKKTRCQSTKCVYRSCCSLQAFGSRVTINPVEYQFWTRIYFPPNVPIQDVMDCAAGVALRSLGRVCLVNEEKAGGGRGERAAQQRARHQLRNPGIKANLARMRKNNLLRLAT